MLYLASLETDAIIVTINTPYLGNAHTTGQRITCQDKGVNHAL